ncbi:MAG: hypothetical protein CBD27_08885 [Rhodospirillaceae bacterium TMED167]|nr:MAG: hypothetical protein CBD27_08885 [Rhodospirillaceae bacterium TMED167]
MPYNIDLVTMILTNCAFVNPVKFCQPTISHFTECKLSRKGVFQGGMNFDNRVCKTAFLGEWDFHM